MKGGITIANNTILNPKVSIVLATYFPSEIFLIKQLTSLEHQTYENIEVLICDDSADDVQFFKIQDLAQRCITKFSVTLLRNKMNIGSNKTFERLTKEAKGDFICYCDQDDIWLPEKVETLLRLAIDNDSKLVYSDLSLINENDLMIHRSFKKSNFRLKHVYGENTFSHLVSRNSVSGCAMLIDSEIAKASIPFPEKRIYVHDHWLAICAAVKGKIAYSRKPLVLYRIHAGNQIGESRLKSIHNLNDYIKARLLDQIDRIDYLEKKLSLSKNNQILAKQFSSLIQSRLHLLKNKKMTVTFLKTFKSDPVLFLFEVAIWIMGEKCFCIILERLRK